MTMPTASPEAPMPTASPEAPTDPVAVLTGFARALRAAGVAADTSRLMGAVTALRHLDATDARQLYWAGRITLCGEPDDLPRYDAVFDRWFRGAVAAAADPVTDQHRPAVSHRLDDPADSADGSDTDDDALRAAAAHAEHLRSHDIAALTDAERDEVNRLVALLTPRVARRRTRRTRRSARGTGQIDVARTVRGMLADGGELARLRHLRPRHRPRRLVLLLDVSGSMAPYADVLLRFAHAAVRVAPATTEVFTAGTRLTRITRQLRLRDPDEALRAAGAAIPDWSGGTRLGEALRAFLDLWGQRGLARGAVVVLASDGWERGEAALLGEQVARLRRLAHRVVWVNPHRGKTGFAPITAGMAAALPHLDDLVAGHSLDALHTLADVIADA